MATRKQQAPGTAKSTTSPRSVTRKPAAPRPPAKTAAPKSRAKSTAMRAAAAKAKANAEAKPAGRTPRQAFERGERAGAQVRREIETTAARLRERAGEQLQDLRGSAEKVWLAGVEALQSLGDQGGTWVERWVEKGEDVEDRSLRGLERVQHRAEEAKDLAKHALRRLETMVDDKVATALDRVGIPTRDEIRGLSRRISELTARVEKLRPAGGKTAKPGRR